MKARIKPRSKLPHLGRILLGKMKPFSTNWQQLAPCFQPLGRILSMNKNLPLCSCTTRKPSTECKNTHTGSKWRWFSKFIALISVKTMRSYSSRIASFETVWRVSSLRTSRFGHADTRIFQYLNNRPLVFVRSRFCGYKYLTLCHLPF
jgi:hypothetical protein